MRGILTYHSIDPSGSPISVDEEAFARHVEFLASDAVRVVSLRKLVAPETASNAGGDSESASAEHTLAVTFDDGFENFATAAWPRLHDAGIPATVFVVTDRVGGDNSWDGQPEPGIPELPLMGWETLGRIAAQGCELGSHSRTHPHLSGLDDGALEDEVAGARATLEERTGTAPWSFCYPYGTHDERTVATVRRYHGAACTTEMRALGGRDGAHALPRLDCYYLRGPGLLESYGSLRFRAYVAARAGLREVRKRVAGGPGVMPRGPRAEVE